MTINPVLAWMTSLVATFFFCLWAVDNGFVVIFLLAAVSIFWVAYAIAAPATYKLPAKLTAPGKEPLIPTHADDHIALDAKNGRLWVSDDRGKRHILDCDDIRGWEHLWTDQHKAFGTYHIRNVMVLRTSNLDAPTIRLNFNRYADMINWRKNYTAAATWHARLTSYLNDGAR